MQPGLIASWMIRGYRSRKAGLAVVLSATMLMTPAQTPAQSGLSLLLECRDWDAISLAPAILSERMAAEAQVQCKQFTLRGAATLECDSTRNITAFGLTTREFGASASGDGTHRLRTVFKASAPRLRDVVSTRMRVAFMATAGGTFEATILDHPERRLIVADREDGSASLICQIAPPRDSAEDLAMGIDRDRGGIGGHLSFPGGAQPAMRICAVPSADGPLSRCVEVATGRSDYLITGLAPADYYVVSFALTENPNRFVGAHASGLKDCPEGRSDCAGGIMVAVTVQGGQIVTDIDPDRFYTQLPPRFDVVLSGDDDR